MEIAVERVAFLRRRTELDPERLVFIDESGVTTAMVRSYARSCVGTRALSRAPAGRYERLTLIGAMSSAGLAALMTTRAFTNDAVFRAFVEQVLLPELVPGQIVVLDNLWPHKRPEIRRLIEGVGCELLFLPRYSPEYNPIEQCWSKMKNCLRGAAARSMEILETAVGDAMQAITAADARGWFRHCGYDFAAH